MRVYQVCIVVAVVVSFLSCKTRRAEADLLTIKLDNFTGMEEHNAKWVEMRAFLWNHWAERKPASLFLTTVSKEGKTTHAEYKIAVLPGNSLILRVSFVRDRIGYQGQVIPKSEDGYEAYTVERVESENPFGVGPESKVSVLPSNTAVPPTKYWLRFKGWGDALIRYF
jgi:hypothetical protein